MTATVDGQRRRLAIAGLLGPFFEMTSIARAQSPGSSVTDSIECRQRARPTPAQIRGPSYRANAPLRSSIREETAPGSPLILTGRVLTPACQPLRGVLIEFWQTDASGNYDTLGFRYRSQQRTDAAGRYRLETILPGPYPTRTRHLHVRLRSPKGRPLSTQIYFEGDPGITKDSMFRKELLARFVGGEARFDFILAG